MANVLKGIIAGVITFIVANQVIALLITGTTLSDTLITNLVPIAIAVGVVLASLGFTGKNPLQRN